MVGHEETKVETKKVETTTKKSNTNSMKDIIIDKVTVNMCIGEGGEELNKGLKVLELVTKKKPVRTKAKVKLPTWGIRPGLPIGGKVTLRGQEALDFLIWTLKAKKNILKSKSVTKDGNFAFGIHEYLDLPGIKYDPSLGISGFDVCVNLKRKGYRVKLRKYNNAKVGKNHVISKNDAIEFIKEKLKVVVE